MIPSNQDAIQASQQQQLNRNFEIDQLEIQNLGIQQPQQTQSQAKQSIEIVDKLEQINLNDLEIMYQKANTLTKLKEFEDAKQIYKDIITINPTHELSYQNQLISQKIKNHINKQRCLLWNRFNFKITIQGNVQQFFFIVLNLKETHQHNQALQYYIKAIEINQSNLEYYFCYGDCLRSLKKYHDAIIAYDKCLRIDANHADTCAGKGICLMHIDMKDEALKNINQSITLKNSSYLGLYGLGLYLDLMGDNQNALKQYNQSLTINPQYQDALHKKGGCLQQMGQYEEAIEWYDKVLAINPQSVNILNNKVIAYNKWVNMKRQLNAMIKYWASIHNFDIKTKNYANEIIYLNKSNTFFWKY